MTICTLDREQLFGRIIDNKMILNKLGMIVLNEWIKTPDLRPYVKLDEFIIMPDHIHGILIIDNCRGVSTYALKNDSNNKNIDHENDMRAYVDTDVGPDVRAYVDTPLRNDTQTTIKRINGNDKNRAYVDTPLRSMDNILPRSTSKTVGSIIRGFKSVVTSNINQLRNTPRTKIWQRNYFEHVIRNQKELDRTRLYIKNNPAHH